MRVVRLLKNTEERTVDIHKLKRDVENAHGDLLFMLDSKLFSRYRMHEHREYGEVIIQQGGAWAEETETIIYTLPSYTYTGWMLNRLMPYEREDVFKISLRSTLRYEQHEFPSLTWKLDVSFYAREYDRHEFAFPEMEGSDSIVLTFRGIHPSQIRVGEKEAEKIVDAMCERLVEFFNKVNFAPLLIASAYHLSHRSVANAVTSAQGKTAPLIELVLSNAFSEYGLTPVVKGLVCKRDESRANHELPRLICRADIEVLQQEDMKELKLADLCVEIVMELKKVFLMEGYKGIGTRLSLNSITLHLANTRKGEENSIVLWEGEEPAEVLVSLDTKGVVEGFRGDMAGALGNAINYYIANRFAVFAHDIARIVHNFLPSFDARLQLTKQVLSQKRGKS